MKFKANWVINSLVLLTITLGACKKNSTEEIEIKNKEKVSEKAKTWFETSVSKSIGSGIEILGTGKPDWATTVYYPGKRIYVIKVRLEKQAKANKYIVLMADERANIIGGAYCVVITENKIDEGHASFDLEVNDGAVLYYQFDNSILATKHYENGREVNKKDIITYKKSKNQGNENPNLVDPDEECYENGGQWQCIDWYWQTWVNGELVYEEYLYSTCACYGATGGGGGTTSTCQNLTMAQVHTLMTNITTETQFNVSISHGQSIMNEETGLITRTSNPIWMFYKANFFLGYYAEYTAYFTGTTFKNNINDFWKWNNISFSSISKSAGTLPPCLSQSISHTVSNPLISGDKKTATATLTNVTITYTYSCFFGSETGTRSVVGLESIFHAEN